MASKRTNPEHPGPKRARRAPATSPEAQEQRMVDLTVALAEQQLLDGTASSQVMTHFLKIGSPREKLERERLAAENELLRKKVEALESARNIETLMETALNAFRSYSPSATESDSFDS